MNCNELLSTTLAIESPIEGARRFSSHYNSHSDRGGRRAGKNKGRGNRRRGLITAITVNKSMSRSTRANGRTRQGPSGAERREKRRRRVRSGSGSERTETGRTEMQTNEHRNHRVHTLFDEDRRQPDKKGEEQAAEMGHGREVEELQAGSCERGAGRSMDAGEMLTNLFFYRCYSVHSQPNAVGRAVGCGRRCSQWSVACAGRACFA